MRTRVSTKGQVVLPGPLRRRLGIHAGDSLDAEIDSGSIVLTPQTKARPKMRIAKDPITGLPVLIAGSAVRPLTGKEVEEILSNFPA